MSVQRRRRRNDFYEQLSPIVFHQNKDLCELDKRRVLMLLVHKLSEAERKQQLQPPQQQTVETVAD